MSSPKPKVVEEKDRVVVTLPVCRRVAGKVTCEPEGLRIVYRRSSDELEGPVEWTLKRPGVEGEGEEVKATLTYKKGHVGPVEVKRHE